MNIQTFNKSFPNNKACLLWLFEAKFGKPVCPKCKKVNKYHLQGETSHFICACGGHQLSPKKNTIFQKSDTDLYKWFFAIYLFSASRNGVSAKELQRQLGVTYKTAWRMAKQIRHLMKQDRNMLSGDVEVDETYIGGERRMASKMENKSAVIGMVERKGKIKAKHIEDRSDYTLIKEVEENVSKGSRLFTDEWGAYRKLGKRGYARRSVQHGRKQFSRGIAHTNTIEGFWGQFKNSLRGTYHAVSSKHLRSYVDEFSFRRNALPDVFEALVAKI